MSGEETPMPAEKKLELRIPSILGFEKVAMEFAASVAKTMNFPAERIEDLKTAVAEACLNAIEHGHKLDASTKVGVSLTMDDSKLQIAVRDEGQGVDRPETPSVEAKMTGEQTPRGWGIFLIENLMDEVQFQSTPEGHLVKMIIHLQK